MKRNSLVLLLFVLIISSCTRDLTDPPNNSCGTTLNYIDDVKVIIDASCAISGCHDGISGIAPGNFSSYEGIEPLLISGSFSSRVFDLRTNPDIGMPPDNAVDVGGVANLEDATIELLMEWVNEGFAKEAIEVVASYDESVKAVIDASCAYSGCHNGTPGVRGDYTTYEGLLQDIESGFFFRRVIDIRDDPTLGMPPDRAPGPKDLTEEEIQLILCWVEKDYPEN